MKQTSLDSLNEHLMESIEMLKNNSDPIASPNEKMDVETAKAILGIGKVMVDGYRVKANVLSIIAKSDILSKELLEAAQKGGFISNEEQKKLS